MRSVWILFPVIAVSVLTALPVRAVDGGGKSTPLTLSSSTIADGEKNVEPEREIKLVFSKNISNITVKENNRGCFTLKDSAGLIIPLQVTLFDDQLDRENRNTVILKPAALEAEKQYILTVSKQLKAKNGVSPEEEIVIRFYTPGFARDSERRSFPVVLVVSSAIVGIFTGFWLRKRNAA